MAINLRAKLAFDGSQFEAGLNRAKASAGRFGRALPNTIGLDRLKSQIAAAFTVGFLSSQSRKLFDYARQVKNTADQFGTTAERTQELMFAAAQTNIELRELQRSFVVIAQRQQTALEGNEKYLQSFERLGVSAEDLRNKRFDQIFLQIAKAVQGTSTNTQQLADMANIFGETGKRVLPGMKQGFGEIATSAGSLGQIIDGIKIERLSMAGDELTTIAGQLRGPFSTAVVGVTKLINRFFTNLKVLSRTSAEVYERLFGSDEVADQIQKGTREFLDEQIKQQRDLKQIDKDREKRQRMLFELQKQGLDIEKATTEEKKKQVTATRQQPELRGISATARQQVGAFAPMLGKVDQDLQESRKQTRLLRSIDMKIERMSDTSSSSSVRF